VLSYGGLKLCRATGAARRGVRGRRFRLSELYATTPLSCSKCGSTDLSALSVKAEVVFWWCATCGSIWGIPTQPVPDSFDADVQRLRTRLQGTTARLDRVASHLERVAASVLIRGSQRSVCGGQRPALCADWLFPCGTSWQGDHGSDPATCGRNLRTFVGFVRTGTKQRGLYQIRRKDGSVVTVRYCSYVDVAPGIHISFITES
jgi:hypothetical protein